MKLTGLNRCISRVASSTKRYSNLPDSYIEREMEQIEWKNPDHGPQYVKGLVKKRQRFYFGEHRPWTREFYNENRPGTYKAEVLVEPVKWTYFKGDLVEVLCGPDKGKKGHVNYIVEERNWVYVDGLNCKYQMVGESKDFPGMMIKREKPLLVTSDVSLIDPSDNKSTTVEWRYTEEGERVRVSVRTGRILPIPIQDQETVDYKSKSAYKEQPKDTTEEELSRVTFQPSLATFQMHIMKSLDIHEERTPRQSFWYYLEERA